MVKQKCKQCINFLVKVAYSSLNFESQQDLILKSLQQFELLGKRSTAQRLGHSFYM